MNRLCPLIVVLFTGASLAAHAASLWPENGDSLFTDNRAYRVGDVLTVIVEEETKVSNAAGSSISKTTSTEGQLEALDLPKAAGAAKVITGDMPKVKFNSERTFEGEGSYELSGSLQTQLTAVVVDVLPNGNLVIEGSRVRRSVDEEVVVKVSGIVRPEDIRSDNSVPSTAIAQAKIVFETRGPITRSSRRGILNRLIDFVWPF